MSDRSFYITTAIDYPNGAPHLGHSLEKMPADVVARYHRLLGDDSASAWGWTRTASTSCAAAPRENGAVPAEWTDRMDSRVRPGVECAGDQRRCLDADDRSATHSGRRSSFSNVRSGTGHLQATYAGWYCPNCNNYYTDDELVGGHCPNHPSITPEWLEEENYFFALSKYTEGCGHTSKRIRTSSRRRLGFPEMLALLDPG